MITNGQVESGLDAKHLGLLIENHTFDVEDIFAEKHSGNLLQFGNEKRIEASAVREMERQCTDAAFGEQIKKPLENYRDIDAFKIYVSDLGLLCAKKDLAANDILYMVEELNDFKGGMTENYVNVQLAINGYNTYYWE